MDVENDSSTETSSDESNNCSELKLPDVLEAVLVAGPDAELDLDRVENSSYEFKRALSPVSLGSDSDSPIVPPLKLPRPIVKQPWAACTDYLMMGHLARSKKKPKRVIVLQGGTKASLAYHLGYVLQVLRRVREVDCIIAEGYGSVAASVLLVAWKRMKGPDDIPHLAQEITELLGAIASTGPSIAPTVVAGSAFLGKNKFGDCPGISLVMKGHKGRVVVPPEALRGRSIRDVLGKVLAGGVQTYCKGPSAGGIYTAIYEYILANKRVLGRIEVHCSITSTDGGKGPMETLDTMDGIGRLAPLVASPIARKRCNVSLEKASFQAKSIRSASTYSSILDVFNGLPNSQLEVYLSQCCSSEPFYPPAVHGHLRELVSGKVAVSNVELRWLANLGYWRRERMMERAMETNAYRGTLLGSLESPEKTLQQFHDTWEPKELDTDPRHLPFPRTLIEATREARECVNPLQTMSYALGNDAPSFPVTPREDPTPRKRLIPEDMYEQPKKSGGICSAFRRFFARD